MNEKSGLDLAESVIRNNCFRNRMEYEATVAWIDRVMKGAEQITSYTSDYIDSIIGFLIDIVETYEGLSITHEEQTKLNLDLRLFLSEHSILSQEEVINVFN